MGMHVINTIVYRAVIFFFHKYATRFVVFKLFLGLNWEAVEILDFINEFFEVVIRYLVIDKQFG